MEWETGEDLKFVKGVGKYVKLHHRFEKITHLWMKCPPKK